MANNRIDKINVGGADYDLGSTNFVFDTYAEYQAAYSAGNIPVGSVVYIKEGSTDGTITALQVVYNNGTVKGALDEINASLAAISQNTPDISIDNAGRKNGQMLYMLLQQIDFSKVNVNTKLEVGTNVFVLATLDSTNRHLRFSRNDLKSDGSVRIINANIQNNANIYNANEGGTYTDLSNEAASAPFIIYY